MPDDPSLDDNEDDVKHEPKADPNQLAEDLRQRMADDDARWAIRSKRIRELNLFHDMSYLKKQPKKKTRISRPRPGDDPLIQSIIQHASRYRSLTEDRQRWLDLLKEQADELKLRDKMNIMHIVTDLEELVAKHADAIDGVLEKLDRKETDFYKARSSSVIRATQEATKLVMHRERLRHKSKKKATDLSMDELIKIAQQEKSDEDR